MLTEVILKAPKKKVAIRFTSNPTKANRRSDAFMTLSPKNYQGGLTSSTEACSMDQSRFKFS
jgi:hypothetical protein